MLAALLFVIGSLGIGFAAVVYRADPQRLDNRLFAAIAGIDATTAFVRGLFAWHGQGVGDPLLLRVVTVLSAVIGIFTIEFAYSFPFSRRLPRWARAVNVVAPMAVVAALLAGAPKGVAELYFQPAFIVTVVLLVRSYRRVRGAGATSVKLVMIAIGVRWLIAELAYDLAPLLGISPDAVFTCESTAAVLGSQLLIGYAVVVGHLFRVRGFLAEVLVTATFALSIVASTAAAIEAALAWAPGGLPLRFCLLAAALIPLALAYAVRRFRARLENAFLGPLDPRRAARETCLDQFMQKAERADVPELLALAKQALAEVTSGGRPAFQAIAGRAVDGADGVLAEAAAAALAPPECSYLCEPDDQLVAPVKMQGEIVGAFVVTGGQIDHDSVVTAVTVAKAVGLRMENRALVAELEESKRLAALGSFAAAIAHDIRTPLTSVQMNVQILRGKARLPADDMEHFDIALDELRRLNAHISQLLDYAKPVRVDPVPYDARELAEEAARTIGPVLAERGVRLVVEDEPAPPVLADGPRIRQVLLNLLENAGRASAPGAEVTVRTAPAADGRVALEVRDCGKGIDARDLVRIFEPFFTTRPDGTGLGLAIVQKLVRAHRGEVAVRSVPGQGTTFTVLLPAVT